MDFNDTPEEARFRAEVRDWLAANAALKSHPGETFRSKHPEQEWLPRARDWQARKHAGGFAALTWPKQYGGRGGTPIQQVIYNQEEAKYLTPRGYYEIGLGMCIPTMLAFASEEQKSRYAPVALEGKEIWCQLFSEPSAGSDVAGLRTKAVRDGSDWIIDGQKIWTSGAHFSDWGIVITRTDPSVPKHQGLTMFFLNMKSPGIEVRPIKQVSGASNFNEVFFTSVRVPDNQRLGKVGEGWKVSIVTLMNERLAVGDVAGPDFDEIFALARTLELDDGLAIKDSSLREKLADWYVQQQGLKYTKFRVMTALSRGQTPGPENSITKVVSANKLQSIAHTAMDLMDMGGAMTDKRFAPMQALFQDSMLASPAARIAGGTDEILKNIIAERVLGLPGDIRVDKDVPFEQLIKAKR